MTHKYLFSTSWCLFTCTSAQTVGVTQCEEGARTYYNLFSPLSPGPKVYLIDNCGRLVNEWGRGTDLGLSAYFLEKPDAAHPQTRSRRTVYLRQQCRGLELGTGTTTLSGPMNSTLHHHRSPTTMLSTCPIVPPWVLTWELVYRDELIEMGETLGNCPEGYMVGQSASSRWETIDPMTEHRLGMAD